MRWEVKNGKMVKWKNSKHQISARKLTRIKNTEKKKIGLCTSLVDLF